MTGGHVICVIMKHSVRKLICDSSLMMQIVKVVIGFKANLQKQLGYKFKIFSVATEKLHLNERLCYTKKDVVLN